jgi:transposase
MSQRRKWSEEFKQQAVELANEPGVSKRRVADDLGISSNMLARWCRERRAHGKAFTRQGIPRDEELAALKRELIRVKKERDFLQEAAAFFAKASK